MIVKSDHERWIVNKIINFMAVHFSREINKRDRRLYGRPGKVYGRIGGC